ncbi:glycosyltransferase 87 family protein [Adhaeribacter pallidiroseus]|uniref:Mannosyltransferase n=1 Tax=Adhaeribacter pallidiroseus TaxID=2072847 RepID=A0A369QHV2_9BACT|nr:glycosyltransferase 87 family protein [Adhaeribacter pallidiroseus]RDC62806.1 hypothetical protein AHMF7616_01400 [Adhaeribacter pallidiroseus]
MARTTSAIFLVLVSVAAYVSLGYVTERTHFSHVLFLFALAFGAYVKFGTNKYFFLKIALLTAFFFRFLFLFSWPTLSDDYFRFIWDGRLLAAGINPFEQLPSYYLKLPEQIPGINPQLYHQLNSPQYYSVYPPVCQFIFAASAWLAPESNWVLVVIMRLTILIAEVGNIRILLKLLQYYNKTAKQVLWYALNPLVIVELTGNLHFEALLLFFLLSSWYFMTQQKLLFAGILFGLAVSVKLVPLLVMPLILAQLGWRKFVVFGSAAGFSFVALFVPFFSPTILLNIGQSINLYFQKFEFNASIYYLFRWLGSLMAGYNPIAILGPSLSLLTAVLISIVAFKGRKNLPEKQPDYWLGAFSLYFF